MIERKKYLDRLISSMNNGMVKVITGIRRCGKSFLLDPIFKSYLLKIGIPYNHIIKIELDREENLKYHHNPHEFNEYLKSLIIDSDNYYLLLDEIQLVDNFELILNGLMYMKNVDIYVTGSNSKFLSSDIITEFRGRSYQIHVQPLSFSEYYSNCSCDVNQAWNEYTIFGGMPQLTQFSSIEDKSRYLKDLYSFTYHKDIVERNKIKRQDILDQTLCVIASQIGSLSSINKIYNTFKSSGEKDLSLNTISNYISMLENAFIINKVSRYNVKGRKYIDSSYKYYFSDVGLRNAMLNFRQPELNHLMENIVYNELIYRGYNVDVGLVEIREKDKRIGTEVDFVCNLGYQRIYIQVTLNISDDDKLKQELKSLNNIGDSFKKIIITNGSFLPYQNDDGILVIGILDFLLNQDSLSKF